jgi:hypothetical protein
LQTGDEKMASFRQRRSQVPNAIALAPWERDRVREKDSL